MSMVIKVEGGTPPNRHLCKTCTHGQIIQGVEQGHYKTYCHYNNEYGPPMAISHQVSNCNRYSEQAVNFHSDKALRDAYYLEKMPYSGLVIGLTYNQCFGTFKGELFKADKNTPLVVGIAPVTPESLLDKAIKDTGRVKASGGGQ